MEQHFHNVLRIFFPLFPLKGHIISLLWWGRFCNLNTSYCDPLQSLWGFQSKSNTLMHHTCFYTSQKVLITPDLKFILQPSSTVMSSMWLTVKLFAPNPEVMSLLHTQQSVIFFSLLPIYATSHAHVVLHRERGALAAGNCPFTHYGKHIIQ